MMLGLCKQKQNPKGIKQDYGEMACFITSEFVFQVRAQLKRAELTIRINWTISRPHNPAPAS